MSSFQDLDQTIQQIQDTIDSQILKDNLDQNFNVRAIFENVLQSSAVLPKFQMLHETKIQKQTENEPQVKNSFLDLVKELRQQIGDRSQEIIDYKKLTHLLIIQIKRSERLMFGNQEFIKHFELFQDQTLLNNQNHLKSFRKQKPSISTEFYKQEYLLKTLKNQKMKKTKNDNLVDIYVQTQFIDEFNIRKQQIMDRQKQAKKILQTVEPIQSIQQQNYQRLPQVNIVNQLPCEDMQAENQQEPSNQQSQIEELLASQQYQDRVDMNQELTINGIIIHNDAYVSEGEEEDKKSNDELQSLKKASSSNHNQSVGSKPKTSYNNSRQFAKLYKNANLFYSKHSDQVDNLQYKKPDINFQFIPGEI